MITKRIKIKNKVIENYETGKEFIYNNNNKEKIVGFIISEDTKKVSLVITHKDAMSIRLLGHVSSKLSRFDFEDETLYYTEECNKWKIIETNIILK